MGLKLYCNRFVHFKDPLVCSVTCPYRARCDDFALFYDEHREEINQLVADYYKTHKKQNNDFSVLATPVSLRQLISLEVKKQMADNTFIWIGKENQAELLTLEEILKRAEDGAKAKKIYKVAQEMELKFQLVPRKRIESAKRIVAADEARAAAKRARKQNGREDDEDFSVPATTTPARKAEPPATTRRQRAAKAVSE